MKKKTRKKLKKSMKALRKYVKQTLGSPAGKTGAVGLGGLTAVMAADPELRARARALASDALSWLEGLVPKHAATDAHASAEPSREGAEPDEPEGEQDDEQDDEQDEHDEVRDRAH